MKSHNFIDTTDPTEDATSINDDTDDGLEEGTMYSSSGKRATVTVGKNKCGSTLWLHGFFHIIVVVLGL